MNRAEYIIGIDLLRASLPQSKVEFDDELKEIWFRMLQDLPAAAYSKAVYEILRTSKFFPSIAEIREVARKFKDKEHLKELPIQTISPERQANNINRIGAIIKNLGRKMEVA